MLYKCYIQTNFLSGIELSSPTLSERWVVSLLSGIGGGRFIEKTDQVFIWSSIKDYTVKCETVWFMTFYFSPLYD